MATGNLITGNISRPSEYAEGSLMPWKTTGIPLIEDYRVVMAKRAVFQGLASMALPALTIHSVVKYSGRMMRNYKSTLLRTWAPIGVRPLSPNQEIKKHTNASRLVSPSSLFCPTSSTNPSTKSSNTVSAPPSAHSSARTPSSLSLLTTKETRLLSRISWTPRTPTLFLYPLRLTPCRGRSIARRESGRRSSGDRNVRRRGRLGLWLC